MYWFRRDPADHSIWKAYWRSPANLRGMSDPRLRTAARLLADADNVVLHTGPGLLADLPVPGVELASAVWGDPEGRFSAQRFDEAPGAVWDDWVGFLADADFDDLAPTPAHECVADLVAAGYVSTLVTENVYGLDERAGIPAERCIEFHGRVDVARCDHCDRAYDVTPTPDAPHRCRSCGEPLKPGVVLADEPPAKHDRLLAYARAEHCDVYLAAGTRLAVDPTAENAEHAVEMEATLAIIGERSTPLDDEADYRLRERAARALPRLRDAVMILGGDGVLEGR